ncbi:acetyl-CoA synthetase-like protein [Aspergillus sclerotioniger CBS 115572]|uniref:Acetyl-CoA synthetase-like protein n=1 Tax=Aspergillus sclerotioniger CBS 115572 TaxID=1450535 RepID=A0A317WVH3_9EURO|nr:acetyl-CoA synthetase-like protein [Aspergillus sclerotioniger CBS 115572]PWY90359.1 acetyl-CoA synthetase-like protein [Aspergillus sclerotioniger CBS 115572]
MATRFPHLTDGQPANDDTLQHIPLDIGHYPFLSNATVDEKIHILTIAWGILLSVYDGNESVTFALGRDGRWSCLGVEINHDACWQDLQVEEQGSLLLGVDSEVNTGVSLGMQIPRELELVLCIDGTDPSLSLAYRPCLLSSGQAVNVASAFEAILTALQRGNVRVREMDMLGEQGIECLSGWNVFPRVMQEGSLYGIVERQAKKNADRVAVDAWDGKLTYRELDEYATQLSGYLISLGLSGSFIPLCADKSVWAVVAMLAILKAGAACSPLEPSNPRSRLESMVKTCEAKTVLVTEGYASLFQIEGVEVVVVSPDIFTHIPQVGISSRISPGAAFLLWTSGSTGAPKGVILEHAALFTSITAYATASQFTPQTRTFQFTSFTFTVSLCDIFGTMSQGGCVCLPSETQRLDDLAGALRDFRATFCWLTSTSLAGLQPSQVPDLRSITVGGESLAGDIVARWASQCRLTVSYGTTETCGWCLLNPALSPTSDARVLGKPTIPAAWITYPDDPNRLVPIGAVGELLVEGPVLARGYLHDEERTAAQFTSSPPWMARFRPGETTRLYRTNDLVRYNSDGSISFVRRRQSHAKIRGTRINLTEIESHVRRACGTVDVVVDVVSTRDRVDVLMAFMLSPGQRQPLDAPVIQRADDGFRRTVARVLQALEDSLPSSMIPTAFVPLSRLPLTRTNKADRRLLRELAGQMSRAELVQLATNDRAVVEAPMSAPERAMQQLWSELTGLPCSSIGVDDSFFHIGGDSVLAIQLVPMAREHGLFLTVLDVFHYPRLGDLVAHVKDAGRPGEDNWKMSSTTPGDIEHLKPDVARQCGVRPSDIEDIYPCTTLQEGLMALSAQRPGSYILTMAYEIPPMVDVARLREAWQAVVRALPILRTRIVHLPSGFHQAVVSESITWDHVDTEGEFRQSNRRNPMSLGSRLARFALLQPDSAPARLLLAVHHSIFDRWSAPLLLAEVEKAYAGQTVALQHFKGFVSYVCSRPAEESDAFWRNRLADASPTVFPRLPDATYLPNPTRSKDVTVLLNASRSDFTATTKLRLCWALLLSQHTGNSDVVFGAVSTGRSAPVEGIESLVGPTLATVPLRVQINGDVSVTDSLQTLQEDAAAMLPHEQCGLQNISRIGPEAKAACAFQSLFIVHASNSGGKLDLMEDQQLPELFSYGLTLSCEVLGPDKIHLQAFFDPGMIEEEYVEILLSQLAHAIRQVNDVPDCKLNDLSLVSPLDEQRLGTWNVPQTQAEMCVHEIIQKQSFAHPRAEAVCSWDGTLTYASLDQLSSQLAFQLHTRGVKQGVFVPLLLEKSKWTPVAMLAVIKSGGAFVLVDPSFPTERLQSTCNQLDAPMVLSSEKYHHLAEQLSRNVLLINAMDHHSPASSLPTVHPNDALYAIFTSGSTGTPKGVIINHSSYATGAQAYTTPACITPTARVLQFASYAFDASIIEHLTTLMAGGCICILSDEERTSSLPEAVAARKANWTWLTPSVVRALDPTDFPTLTHLCLMGESMTRTEIEKWSQHVHLMQAYGPAECSVLATLQPTLSLHSDPRDIGTPRGCNTWIVDWDDHTRLAPVGTIGELLIEGPIVGRGYHGNVALTEGAFLKAPEWMQRFHYAPARVYRTGDLVQYSSRMDGSLLYIARKDTQVKIRGQRLELSEVEYHARVAMDGTFEVVVDVVKSGGRAMLALFYVQDVVNDCPDVVVLPMSPEQRMVLVQVRQILESRLPSFMIPTVWIPVTRIPLSPSRKTDRRRLQSLVGDLTPDGYKPYIIGGISDNAQGSFNDESEQQHLSENEILLQRLIRQVLDGDNEQPSLISIDELFINIGGDSLTALSLTSLAKQSGFTFTAGDVLGCTVGELARMRVD